MWEAVKEYWDLIVGFIVGVGLSFMAHIDSEIVRRIYSVIILILVCMAFFRTVRQTIEKKRIKKKERQHNVIDAVVDNLSPVKTIRIAENPTKEGEKIEELFIKISGGHTIMKKFKELFDKYKGYFLTVLLAILTAIEMFSGVINQLCGGVFVINGVEVLPFATLLITTIVGLISNGWTKEQNEKIKALFSKSSTDELVKAEIRKSFKDNTVKHSEFTKILSTKEKELECLHTELQNLKNTLSAKKEMYVMIPQLATEEDVQLASNAVYDCETRIYNKGVEIDDVKATLETLKTNINALKSQL